MVSPPNPLDRSLTHRNRTQSGAKPRTGHSGANNPKGQTGLQSRYMLCRSNRISFWTLAICQTGHLSIRHQRVLRRGQESHFFGP